MSFNHFIIGTFTRNTPSLGTAGRFLVGVVGLLSCSESQPTILCYKLRAMELACNCCRFKKKEQRFDSTKIPDLVDNVRYDLIHHHAHIGTAALQAAISIYTHAEPLAHFIAPAEYGLTPHQKTEIGSKLISKLLKKILADITFFRRDTADQPLFMMHAPPVKPNDLPANTQPASLVTCDKKINGVKIPSTSSALPTTISSAANCHTHQFPPASPENLTPQRSLMEKNIAGANSQSPPFIQPDTSPPKIDSSGGDTSSCPNVVRYFFKRYVTLCCTNSYIAARAIRF